MDEYSYFDADYFENGGKKGTAYNNFLEASRTSAAYRELADIIAKVFRPKRALEIGCATGIVVKYINDMGYEAHGIDVSSWAIDNREHDNVVLASADALPYPDGYFDVIYSGHSLEHIPLDKKDGSFRELARVSSADAVHLHTLPIIGMGPYKGDPELVKAGLRHDPTHNLLFDRSWWLREFKAIGFSDLKTPCMFASESWTADMSVSQLLLAKTRPDDALLDRLAEWNAEVLEGWVQRALSAEKGVYSPSTKNDYLDITLDDQWDDITLEPGPLKFSDSIRVVASVSLESEAPLALRFCLFHDASTEATRWWNFNPGTTHIEFAAADMKVRGDLNGLEIRKIHFGGKGTAKVRLSLHVYDKDSENLLRRQMERQGLAVASSPQQMRNSRLASFDRIRRFWLGLRSRPEAVTRK